jgi:hypothetical protein
MRSSGIYAIYSCWKSYGTSETISKNSYHRLISLGSICRVLFGEGEYGKGGKLKSDFELFEGVSERVHIITESFCKIHHAGIVSDWFHSEAVNTPVEDISKLGRLGEIDVHRAV